MENKNVYPPEAVLEEIAKLMLAPEAPEKWQQPVSKLENQFNLLLEKYVHPSGYENKNKLTDQINCSLKQLRCLSRFPALAGKHTVCFVGFSVGERKKLFSTNKNSLNGISYNTSVPSVLTSRFGTDVLYNAYQCAFREGARLKFMLDSFKQYDLDVGRMFSAWQREYRGCPEWGAIIDCPQNTPPDSPFLIPFLLLARKVVFSISSRSKMLVRSCLYELEKYKAEQPVYIAHATHEDKVQLRKEFRGLQLKFVSTPKLSAEMFPLGPIDNIRFTHGVKAEFLLFRAWLKQQQESYNNYQQKIKKDAFLSEHDDIRKYLKAVEGHYKEYTATLKALSSELEYFFKLADMFEKNYIKSVNLADETFVAGSYEGSLNYFHALLSSGELLEAKNIALEIANSGFPYNFILNLYLAEKKGKSLSPEEVQALAGIKDNSDYILRARLHFHKQISLPIVDAGSYALKLKKRNSEEEHLLAEYWEDVGDLEKARRHYRTALKTGSQEAGSRLLALLDKDDALQWNDKIKSLNFLAKHGVPDVNFALAQEYEKAKKWRQRGFHLKLAATEGDLEAIRKIADNLFREDIKSQAAVKLYTHLDDCGIKDNTIQSRIGQFHYHEGRFSKALQLLKEIDDSYAHFYCGKMYEFGDGTCEDLDAAKMHYEKACVMGHKGASARLPKVEDKLRWANTSPKFEDDDYYKPTVVSSSSSSSSSDGWCFITTATCRTLGLKDDNDVLNAFRQYRDQILPLEEDGTSLIAEYYEIAPHIVRAIDQCEESSAIYMAIWNQYLQGCYQAICLNNYSAAKEKYVEMVRTLEQAYLPS